MTEMQDDPPLGLVNRNAEWMPPSGATLAAWKGTRIKMPWLAAALDAGRLAPFWERGDRLDGYVGWGLKPPARIARYWALARRFPYWIVEDGFLRSVGLGKSGVPPISIVVDDLGIHFDARTPSRFERICADHDFQPMLERARDLRSAVVRFRLTKYNHLPDIPPRLPPKKRPRVLLIDQVDGDFSVIGGCANRASFAAMLDTALKIRRAPTCSSGCIRTWWPAMSTAISTHSPPASPG
ncbi:hypothetical protein [Methylobrevis pamukkalensis]|uniref:Capsule polysaccharide biosynthesis protein n=1 Tax=Methylobrevis pamukkalensis TaxID=1439726 RepID=A0A1E3H6Q2_9HYPH|nr:hypothetical protein [Methylobrevis pamukkalensis]ODN71984.1 Capsule polysaccharide biosynthesis protein [Methylobrevis pamukkalensis]